MQFFKLRRINRIFQAENPIWELIKGDRDVNINLTFIFFLILYFFNYLGCCTRMRRLSERKYLNYLITRKYLILFFFLKFLELFNSHQFFFIILSSFVLWAILKKYLIQFLFFRNISHNWSEFIPINFSVLINIINIK